MADPIVETTDANGEATFTLDDYERDHDTYTATISKTHYVTQTLTFEATKDEEFDITLEKTLYTISCTVKDDTSEDPIQGAVITFTDSTDPTIEFESGVSGSAGGCTLKATAGTYVVTAVAEGYDDYTAGSNVTVTDDDTLTVSLTATVQTGTVTVTALDGYEEPAVPIVGETATVVLATEQVDWADPDFSKWVAVAHNFNETGTATLSIADPITGNPTEDTDIPFGTYYLCANGDGIEYSGTLTVDGDETVSITLIPIDGGDG